MITPKSFLQQLTCIVRQGRTGPRRKHRGREFLLKLAAPYLQNLDRRRTAAITSALGRLQILQKEGVVLAMPGFLLQE